MSRINTNVSSMIAQRVMSQKNDMLSQSMERLSTGLRINSGKDDPAGLIASENLRSEKASISAAMSNAERADLMVSTAEGGLAEVGSMLNELQGLVTETANEAGLSDAEKDANQQQVDAILQTIDRISSTTSFQGTKLLNGSLDFQVGDVSGGKVAEHQVKGANVPEGGLDVQATVTQSAQHGGMFLSTGGDFDLNGASAAAADATFSMEVAGARGARAFNFSSGTTLSNAAASINNFSDTTGVSATVSGGGMVLKSTGYGSDQFVSVDVRDDAGQSGAIVQLSAGDENALSTESTAFSSVESPVRDGGQDVAAIINGIQATGEGTTASVNTDALNASIDFTASGATNTGSFNAMTITGGGATFQIGPDVNVTNQVNLGIGSVSSRDLGGASVGGMLSDLGSGGNANLVDGDASAAQKIVEQATSQVANLRGRLGAFQKNTLDSTINSLGVALENTSAAESAIRDTDFAAETAKLTRSQVMVQASQRALGIANNRPQSVLGLLG